MALDNRLIAGKEEKKEENLKESSREQNFYRQLLLEKRLIAPENASVLQCSVFKRISKDVLSSKFLLYLDLEHDLKTTWALGIVNKNPSHLFNEYLHSVHSLQVKKFFQHVVFGEQKEAEAMIKVNPRLLLDRAKIIDYSGRKIEGTALQIALGAKDVRVNKKKGEAMVEMIERYLRMREDGELEISKQKAEQFPSGWKEEEKKNDENDLAALNRMVKAINASEIKEGAKNDIVFDKELDDELNKFIKYLKPENVIKTGNHFRYKILSEALKLYDTNYFTFGGRDSPKNKFFWRKVIIGSIEGLLPACDAQVFCQGLDSVLKGGELKRSIKFLDGVSYFPLDSDPSSRLGIRERRRAGPMECSGYEARMLAEAFIQFSQEKISVMEDLLRPHLSYVGSRCAIM